MPDLRISQLPVASTPLAGTELVPIVQGGITEQTTVQAIMSSTVPSGTANGVLYLNGSKVATSGSSLVFDGSNLGVGATPLVKFQVRSQTNGNLGVQNSVNATGGVRLNSFNDAGNAPSPMELDGSPLVFNISTTEQMRLTSTGLGIGTSSPGYRLSVQGAAEIRSAGAVHWRDASNTSFASVFNSSGAMVFETAFTERMRLDSSGNLGLGVTPSAWNTGGRAFELNAGAVYGFSNAVLTFGANVFYNTSGQYIYKASIFALDYRQRADNGQHQWFTAPSGTAGNAISFTQAMTLDANGRLLVGTTAKGVYGGNTVEFRGANIATPGSNDTGNLSIFTTDSQAANVGATVALGGIFSGTLPYAFGAIAARKSNSTAGNAEGYLQFFTTDNSNAIVERARIDSSGNLIQSAPTTPPTLSTNGTMVFNLTSNTNLRISVRGSDGVTRVANITLA